jgi:exonuclease 1
MALRPDRRRYAHIAMGRVRMLQHFGVKPYLVFDGDYLPSKGTTENRKAGLELLKAGKPSQAHPLLQKSIDVTPEMARELIEELKKAGIPYIVAPYEADAQLVYLERQGIISGILSEDSDLLVFGAKRLLTKLEKTGQCIEINRRDFSACRSVSLTGWTDDDFRQMTILSGCDYLARIGKVGLKNAYRLVRKYKKIEKVVQILQFDGQYRVPSDYLARFRQAELTFLHQRVFCPQKQEQVFLTPLPAELNADEMPYIGAHVEPGMARSIAVGDVNPMTKAPIEPLLRDKTPQKRGPTDTSRAPAKSATERRPKGKDIESYFKEGRRVPLGEMDPNCFSIDPNRVASTTEDGDRPIVFPLPRPYVESPGPSARSRSYLHPTPTSASPRIMRRRTEPISNIFRDNQIASAFPQRQRVGSGWSGPRNMADPSLAPPAKKARLCDDRVLDSLPVKEKSKFFPKRAKQSPAKGKADAFLMSDDSIENAMQELPDLDTWVGRKKPLQEVEIFEESSGDLIAAACGAGVVEETEHEPLRQVRTTRSFQHENSTQRTPSFVSRYTFSQTTSHGDATQARGSLANPELTQSTRSSVGHSSVASTAASSVLSSAISSSTRSTPATPMMTPLQRLGARALNRKSHGTPSDRSHQLQPRRTFAKPSLDSFPVNPAFVPLPPVSVEEVEALHRPVGSEDLLHEVSDLEDAGGMDEAHGSPKDQTRASGRIDLSRFLCA